MKKSKFWAFFEPAKVSRPLVIPKEGARSEKTFSFDRHLDLFKNFNPVIFVLQNDTMIQCERLGKKQYLSFFYSTSSDATKATKDLLSFVTICFLFPVSIIHFTQYGFRISLRSQLNLKITTSTLLNKSVVDMF